MKLNSDVLEVLWNKGVTPSGADLVLSGGRPNLFSIKMLTGWFPDLSWLNHRKFIYHKYIGYNIIGRLIAV